MGSQPLTAFVLVGLGIRHLSVAPRAVPMMKRVLRSIGPEAAKEAAQAALASSTAAEAERIVRRLLLAAAHDLSPAELGLLGSETGDILGYAV
jgi:signal transduction protein with GAF and PtsI domain